MARVTVWNEYRHEQENDAVADVYPDGIHAVIADALREAGPRSALRPSTRGRITGSSRRC